MRATVIVMRCLAEVLSWNGCRQTGLGTCSRTQAGPHVPHILSGCRVYSTRGVVGKPLD